VRKIPVIQSARYQVTPQRVLVIALVLVLGWLAWSLRETLIPYIVGILVVQLLSPLVRLVEKHLPGRRLRTATRRRIAAMTVYVVAALAFAVFFIFLARRILDRMGAMILGVPVDWHRAITENSTIHAWYVDTVPADVRAEIEKSLAAASVDAATWLQHSVTAAINTASGLVNAVVTIAAVGLFVFYVMIADERMPSAATSWISPAWRLHFQHVRVIAHRTITSYARALLTEATIVGSLTGIGLFLAGVNTAVPLGIAGGLLNLVPYIGYWLALLLSVVVVAGTQPDKLALAVVIYLLVQSADNWYFAPHYQGGSTGWTPAQTLVIMACGSATFGPIGLIISLPLAAFARETLLYAYRGLAAGPSEDDVDPKAAATRVGQRDPAALASDQR
jgi:predicted PurR-regulated permease PerM